MQSPKWVSWQGWVMLPPHHGWKMLPYGCNYTEALPDSTSTAGTRGSTSPDWELWVHSKGADPSEKGATGLGESVLPRVMCHLLGKSFTLTSLRYDWQLQRGTHWMNIQPHPARPGPAQPSPLPAFQPRSDLPQAHRSTALP